MVSPARENMDDLAFTQVQRIEMGSRAVTIILLCVISGISCNAPGRKKDRSFKASTDSVTAGAQRFRIERNDSCTILTITDPWQGAEGVNHVFYLVGRDQEPLHNDSLSIINVPVEKIICMSSTHVAMIKALGMEKTICGISGTGFIYDSVLAARAANGIIPEIGYDAAINTELIISLNPDLMMMYGVGSESMSYVSRLSGLGIKVVYNADYLETDPLAKAGWIRVFGALYGLEDRADSIYDSIASEYGRIRRTVNESSRKRPSVLLGLPYRDTWYISPGNSYISTLIHDAGGEYLWENTTSGFSMPYSIESVYLKALKADFWLNIGTVSTKGEIESFDSRLKNLPAYINGNLYNNTGRMSAGGGNDYWESGTLNPHILLKDIASILNPGIFGDYSLIYYKKIK